MRADKGKTLIIMPKQNYNQKVKHFINNNSFEEIAHNPTEEYQKDMRSCLTNNNNVIQRTQKWKLINLNPQPLNLRELIKLHKPNSTIRPIIN
jgi:hypothetical protein